MPLLKKLLPKRRPRKLLRLLKRKLLRLRKLLPLKAKLPQRVARKHRLSNQLRYFQYPRRAGAFVASAFLVFVLPGASGPFGRPGGELGGLAAQQIDDEAGAPDQDFVAMGQFLFPTDAYEDARA